MLSLLANFLLVQPDYRVTYIYMYMCVCREVFFIYRRAPGRGVDGGSDGIAANSATTHA